MQKFISALLHTLQQYYYMIIKFVPQNLKYNIPPMRLANYISKYTHNNHLNINLFIMKEQLHNQTSNGFALQPAFNAPVKSGASSIKKYLQRCSVFLFVFVTTIFFFENASFAQTLTCTGSTVLTPTYAASCTPGTTFNISGVGTETRQCFVVGASKRD